MYVSDSLFFLQHLFTQADDQEHGTVFNMKLREIIQHYDENGNTALPKESADDIKNRMIEKSLALSGKQT